MTTDLDTLRKAAEAVREHAYARYSGYRVGSALIDENGQMHVGANAENAAYPLGSCAEANAIGAMVSAGGRRIKTIVALGGRDELEACTPCGGCRQRIAEFADQETDIVLLDQSGELAHYTLDGLLPASFSWPESS
jgi:cytidine deaminase